jgi:hypothetical protein
LEVPIVVICAVIVDVRRGIGLDRLAACLACQ